MAWEGKDEAAAPIDPAGPSSQNPIQEMPQGDNTAHYNACGGTGVTPPLPAFSTDGLECKIRGPVLSLPPIPNFSAQPSVATASSSAQAAPYTAGRPAGIYYDGQGHAPSAAFAGGYHQAHDWPGIGARANTGAAAQTDTAAYARSSASVYPGGERGLFLGHLNPSGPGFPLSAHHGPSAPISGQLSLHAQLASQNQTKRTREESETPRPAVRAEDPGYHATPGTKVEAESTSHQNVPPATTAAGTYIRPFARAGGYMHNATVGGVDGGPAGYTAVGHGTTAPAVAPGLLYSAMPRYGWGPIPFVNTDFGPVPGPGSVLPLSFRSPLFQQGQKEHRYVNPAPPMPNPYKRVRTPSTPWSSTSSGQDYIGNDARRSGGVPVAASG